MAADDEGPPSVNDVILRRTIRHAILVNRFGVGLGKRMVRFLDEEVYPDLVSTVVKRLERIKSRGIDTGPWTTQRYKDLLDDIRTILRDAALQMRMDAAAELRDLAKSEANWAHRMLTVAMPKELQIDIGGINLNAVQAVVSKPIMGAPLQDWFGGLAKAAQTQLTRQIGIGLAEGEPADKIITRVRRTLDVPRNHAATIVRTASNQVGTQARQTTYEENGGLLKGVKWLATLDTRTSAICRARDGQVYPLDSGPRPPAHPNCRSVVTPIVKSAAELGLRRREITGGTRASMNGQVPRDLTYEQWLKTQDTKAQNEALGTRRAQMWRSGRITMDDMVTKDGRELTLAELEQLDG